MAGLREVLRHVLAAFRRRKLDDEAAALEQVPDQRGLRWLDGTALDLRHAIAALKHQPGFTLITVAALGPWESAMPAKRGQEIGSLNAAMPMTAISAAPPARIPGTADSGPPF